MAAIAYLLRKTIKNWVFDLRSKPQMLVLIAFVLLMLGLSAGGGKSAVHPYQPEFVSALFFAAALLFGGFILYGGLAETRTFFRMADVNLLFTAPLRPSQVIVYGMLRNVSSLAFAMLILVYQMGTLRFTLGMPAGLIAAAFACMFAALLIFLTSSMCLLLFTSGRPGRLKGVKTALAAAAALLLVFAFAQARGSLGASPAALFTALCADPRLDWVPVAGWARGLYAGIAAGNAARAALCGGGLAALLGAEVWGIAHTRADYYEDVLDGAARRETALAAAREGRRGFSSLPRREKAISRFGLGGGSGASALYYKRMLERRRGAFGIVGLGTVLVAGCALFFSLVLRASYDSFLLTAAMLGLVFRRVSSWEGELDRVYIYLLPESPERKLFFVLVPDLYAALVDGAVALLAGLALFHEEPLAAIAGAASFASASVLVTASSVVVRRVFGSDSKNSMVQIVAVYLPMLLLAAGVGLGAAVQSAVFGWGGEPFFLFGAVMVWDLALSSLMLVLGRGVLDVAGR